MPGPLPRRFPVVCPPHHRAAEEYENDGVFRTCVTGRQRKNVTEKCIWNSLLYRLVGRLHCRSDRQRGWWSVKKDASISDVDSAGRFRRIQQKNSKIIPESSESSSSPLWVRGVETRKEDSWRRFGRFRAKKKRKSSIIFDNIRCVNHWWLCQTELAVGPFERAWSQIFRTALVGFSRFFSEKNDTEAKRLVIFVCFRTGGKSISARKSASHRKAATNDRRSFYEEAEFTVFVGNRYGSEVTNCDKSHNKSHNCDFLSQFVTSDTYLCPTKTMNSASPWKKRHRSLLATLWWKADLRALMLFPCENIQTHFFPIGNSVSVTVFLERT